jgi:hypothetical protein
MISLNFHLLIPPLGGLQCLAGLLYYVQRFFYICYDIYARKAPPSSDVVAL